MWTTIPYHLRVAFLCSVSLVWQVALSTLTFVSPAERSAQQAARKDERHQLHFQRPPVVQLQQQRC